MPVFELPPGTHDLGTLPTEETTVIRGREVDVIFGIVSRTDGSTAARMAHQARPNWPRNRAHVRLELTDSHADIEVDGPNIQTEGFHDDGPWREWLEGQHGVEFEGCHNVTGSVTGRNVYGDAVYVDNSTGLDVKVDFAGCGRQGIAIASGRDLLFRGRGVRSIRRSAVDLEPYKDGQLISGVKFKGMDFDEFALSWLACASSRGMVEDVEFVDCTSDRLLAVIRAGGPEGARTPDRRFRRFRFRDCTARNRYGSKQGAAFQLQQVDYVTLTRVSQDLQAKRPSTDPPMRLVRAEDCRWVREIDCLSVLR